MPYKYCLEWKMKLDHGRHHAINHSLLKLYLAARLEVHIEKDDRLCVRCRSSFDSWREKFDYILNDFSTMVGCVSFISFYVYFVIFIFSRR